MTFSHLYVDKHPIIVVLLSVTTIYQINTITNTRIDCQMSKLNQKAVKKPTSQNNLLNNTNPLNWMKNTNTQQHI